MERVKKVAGIIPLMKILPYKKFKVGLIVTGSEIFHGRIDDTFTPIIESTPNTGIMSGIEKPRNADCYDRKPKIPLKLIPSKIGAVK